MNIYYHTVPVGQGFWGTLVGKFLLRASCCLMAAAGMLAWAAVT